MSRKHYQAELRGNVKHCDTTGHGFCADLMGTHICFTPNASFALATHAAPDGSVKAIMFMQTAPAVPGAQASFGLVQFLSPDEAEALAATLTDFAGQLRDDLAAQARAALSRAGSRK